MLREGGSFYVPSYLCFNCSKVSLDGLGLTNKRGIFLFVASNALFQFSYHVTNLIGLKWKSDMMQ